MILQSLEGIVQSYDSEKLTSDTVVVKSKFPPLRCFSQEMCIKRKSEPYSGLFGTYTREGLRPNRIVS